MTDHKMHESEPAHFQDSDTFWATASTEHGKGLTHYFDSEMEAEYYCLKGRIESLRATIWILTGFIGLILLLAHAGAIR